jgi:hypothetical protein
MHFPKLFAPLGVCFSLATALPTPGGAEVDRPFSLRWDLREKQEPAETDRVFHNWDIREKRQSADVDRPFSHRWDLREKREPKENNVDIPFSLWWDGGEGLPHEKRNVADTDRAFLKWDIREKREAVEKS